MTKLKELLVWMQKKGARRYGKKRIMQPWDHRLLGLRRGGEHEDLTGRQFCCWSIVFDPEVSN